jgi:hypothetical protein
MRCLKSRCGPRDELRELADTIEQLLEVGFWAGAALDISSILRRCQTRVGFVDTWLPAATRSRLEKRARLPICCWGAPAPCRLRVRRSLWAAPTER